MDTFSEETTFDFDGIIALDDTPVVIEIECEAYPAEPYSWGQPRGMETECSAKITAAWIGNKKVSREFLVEVFDERTIVEAEDSLAARYLENLESAA